MYSGLVETIGTVKKITHNKGSSEFIITAPAVLSDCKLGDSLGVNGTCLTVEKFDEKDFQVTAVPETLRKTNLIYLSEGAPVNVERCLQASARVGGHFFYCGHGCYASRASHGSIMARNSRLYLATAYRLLYTIG